MIIKIFNRAKRRLEYYKMFYSRREKFVSNGEDYPDKTFYVIGINYETQGLLAIVKNVLIHIEYALDKGYIPVVDMRNFESQFSNNKQENVWELFFCQPSHYTLADINSAKKVIYSRNITTWLGHSIFLSILDENNVIRFNKLKRLYQQYITPNKDLETYIVSKYAEIIGNKGNVLGVLCRGTDYTQKRPSGHPVQPSFVQIKEKINEFRSKHPVDFIFVATEDAEYMEKFKNEYGDMILCVDQTRFGDLKVDYISELGIDNKSLVKMNKDYYTSLYILSRCNYFISGKTAGTLGVAFMTEGFKDYYYFELGHYK